MLNRKVYSRSSFKIYLVVYVGLIILSSYLIGSNYFSHVRQAEESTLSNLYGIASTLSHQVDRDAIQAVFKKYPLKGDTAGVSSDPVLKMYIQLFQKTVQSNGLKTPIYTLTYDSVYDRFLGGVASNGMDSYGWHYKSPPAKLKELYRIGGTIPRFEDDHGTWLTAVCPLVNSQGEVFAVIEADYPFDLFLQEARNELVGNVLVSLLVMFIIGALTYPFLNRILSAEERAKLALEEANELIRQKNDELTSSLEYARTIQETMLPDEGQMSGFFSSCMILNQPRDIVSGDFYWFHKVDENTALVAVADCTGHGVPGALMSIMGHSYLNEIVTVQQCYSPCEILERLDRKILEVFSPSADKSMGTNGMDVGICLVNKLSQTVFFAGARSPLVILDRNSDRTLSGAKRGIGEHFLASTTPFRNIELPFTEGSYYFLFTDGLKDQFGGPDGKKLMSKRLLALLKKSTAETSLEMALIIGREFELWKGNYEQVDDICLISFSA